MVLARSCLVQLMVLTITPCVRNNPINLGLHCRRLQAGLVPEIVQSMRAKEVVTHLVFASVATLFLVTIYSLRGAWQTLEAGPILRTLLVTQIVFAVCFLISLWGAVVSWFRLDRPLFVWSLELSTEEGVTPQIRRWRRWMKYFWLALMGNMALFVLLAIGGY